ncbi:MAG: phage integrase N-terminal SAM-like domain-containing protein [archaeon]
MHMNEELIKTELLLRGSSNRTIECYLFHNRKFEDYIKKSPKLVRESDIKSYLIYLRSNGYEKNTINLANSAIHFYYCEILKRKFHIKRMKKDKILYPVLSKEEVKKIIENAKRENHRLFLRYSIQLD